MHVAKHDPVSAHACVLFARVHNDILACAITRRNHLVRAHACSLSPGPRNKCVEHNHSECGANESITAELARLKVLLRDESHLHARQYNALAETQQDMYQPQQQQ